MRKKSAEQEEDYMEYFGIFTDLRADFADK